MIFSTFKENFQNKSADVIYWAFFSNFSWEYFDKYDNVGRWQADDGFYVVFRRARGSNDGDSIHPVTYRGKIKIKKKKHVFLLQTEGGWSQDQETRRTSGAVER